MGRAGITALLVLTVVGTAWAHTRLVSSSPSDGDTMKRAPATVRLLFSTPVDPALSPVIVIDAGGTLHTLDLRGDPDEEGRLEGDLPAGLRGVVRVSWQVLADDGHPVTGQFAFVVEGPDVAGSGAPDEPPAQDDTTADGRGQVGTEGGRIDLLAGLLRGLAVGCLLALAGLLVSTTWIVPATAGPAVDAARLLALIAPALLVLHIAVWAVTVLPTGSGVAGLAALSANAAGRTEIVRLGVTIAASALLLAFGRRGSAAIAAIGAVLVGGTIGHPLMAAGSPGTSGAALQPALAIAAKAIHMTAAAIWLGALLHLVLDIRDMASIQRVSAVALGGALTIAVTGISMAILFVPDMAALWTSSYGRLVIAKLTGFGILLVFGAFHRYETIPEATATGDAAPLHRSVRREVVVMTIVILVSGLLASVAPPGV